MKTIKVRKKFFYDNILIRIVRLEEPYMNSGSMVTVERVIAPNGGQIPVKMDRNETLKSIQDKTIKLLDIFKKAGADVQQELTKEIPEMENYLKL